VTESKTFVHSTAEVSPEASVGKGTKIWNQAQVREKAVIGENCIISKDVYVDQAVTIGDRCKIQNGVSIYNGVTLEDEVFLGPHCVLTNDLRPRAFSHGFKVIPTRICRGASVGAGAVVVCGTTIGSYALVGAGAVVTRDVPPHALVVGNPARVQGYVCKCGRTLSKGAVAPKKLTCDSCG
jgi:acetyltransferase-like isoleucine patch superfamily enzyme